MKYLNLYTLASIASYPSVKWAQLRGKPVPSLSMREQVREKASALLDKVSGRSDTFTHIPSHDLYNVKPEDEKKVKDLGARWHGHWIVPEGKWRDEFSMWGEPYHQLHNVLPEEEEIVKALGAEKNPNGKWLVHHDYWKEEFLKWGQPTYLLGNVPHEEEEIVKALGAQRHPKGIWVVPEGAWRDEFIKWGLPVPEDLVHKTPRLGRTKDGKPVEGYKTIDDEGKGPDSTALPIMYGMLVVLSAITYAFLSSRFGQNHLGLASIFLLATFPYVMAISLSEKATEAAKAFMMLYVLPLVLSALSSDAALELPFVSGLQSLIPMGGQYMLVFVLLAVAFLVGVVFTLTGGFDDDENASKGFVGGAIEGVKHFFKWLIIIFSAMAIVSYFDWIPDALAYFGLACLYPMVYSEHEFNKREEILATRGKQHNMASKGGLADALLGPKYQQAVQAAKDRSPLFFIGVAKGYLSKIKEYGLSPDKGVRMMQSLMDSFTHTLVIGRSGIGKTTQTALIRIQQLAKLKGEIGGYFDDGKRSLVGDVRKVMDIIVEPGVDFALFEGLNAQEVAQALNHRSKKGSAGGDGAHWEEGTDNFIDHATVLLEAFEKHERDQRNVAIAKMQELMPLLDTFKVRKFQADSELERLVYEADIKDLEERIAGWKNIALKKFHWDWNGESLERLTIAMNQPREIDEGGWVASEEITEWCAYLGHGVNDELRISSPYAIHPQIGVGSILDNSIQFALRQWPMLPEATRGSYMSHVIQRLNPFMRNPKFVNKDGIPWNKLTKGVRVEDALYGKLVGPNLPEGDTDKGAILISALIKQRIYKGIKRRLGMSEQEWRAEGQKPMQIIWDECQDLLGDEDMELLPKARSGQVGYMFLTQGIDSLVTAFGSKDVAINFANTCESWICLNAKKESYEYFSDRLGQAMLTSYPEQVQGIDYNGAILKYLNSPFNDKDHPGRAALRKLEKQGAAQFIVGQKRNPLVMSSKEEGMSVVDMSKGIVVNVGGQKTMQPILKVEDFENLLIGQGSAIVCVNRANVRHVDWCEMDYVKSGEMR